MAGEGLPAALDMEPFQAALYAATCGTLFHISVLRPLEVEQFMYSLLILGLLTPIALALVDMYHGFSCQQAASQVALVSIGFQSGIFLSIGIYRLFYHPLRSFPGPWKLKLSRFSSCAVVAREFKYHEELERMHERYGDFIRTALDTYQPRIKRKVDDFISEVPKRADGVDGGSETTVSILASAFYFLAKYPAIQTKLQKQVDAIMPSPEDWAYEKVKTVSFLDDINETLRLKPALMTGGYRETPDEGIQVDEQYIPVRTNVFIPQWLIQRDARYWKQPNEFIPERFGERMKELGTDGAPFMPFGIGPYNCPGKNLATLTMRITLSRVAQEFDVCLAPGETGEHFENGAMDTFSTTLPLVMLQFKRRGRDDK